MYLPPNNCKNRLYCHQDGCWCPGQTPKSLNNHTDLASDGRRSVISITLLMPDGNIERHLRKRGHWMQSETLQRKLTAYKITLSCNLKIYITKSWRNYVKLSSIYVCASYPFTVHPKICTRLAWLVQVDFIHILDLGLIQWHGLG